MCDTSVCLSVNKTMFKIIIKNLVIIGAITGATFLSQQPLFSSNNEIYGYSNGIKNATGENVKKTENWFTENVYPRSNGGERDNQTPVASIDTLTASVENTKNNLLENSVDNSKKIIAENFLKLLGVKPEDLWCKAN